MEEQKWQLNKGCTTEGISKEDKKKKNKHLTCNGIHVPTHDKESAPKKDPLKKQRPANSTEKSTSHGCKTGNQKNRKKT